MARYIDADKFREKAFYADTEADIVHYIRQYGYVDVVPRSDIEQLKRNLEQCENGYRQEMHLLQCKLADEQSKVMKIFEVIDGITDLVAKGLIGELEFYDKIAELKKKYTESEGNI